MKEKLLKLIRVVASFIPRPLPMKDSEFTAWAEDIADLSGFPFNDSIQFAIATMVLHTKSGQVKVAKRDIVIQLQRAAANQCAGNLMQELKARQKAADEQRRAEEASGQVVS